MQYKIVSTLSEPATSPALIITSAGTLIGTELTPTALHLQRIYNKETSLPQKTYLVEEVDRQIRHGYSLEASLNLTALEVSIGIISKKLGVSDYFGTYNNCLNSSNCKDYGVFSKFRQKMGINTPYILREDLLSYIMNKDLTPIEFDYPRLFLYLHNLNKDKFFTFLIGALLANSFTDHTGDKIYQYLDAVLKLHDVNPAQIANLLPAFSLTGNDIFAYTSLSIAIGAALNILQTTGINYFFHKGGTDWFFHSERFFKSSSSLEKWVTEDYDLTTLAYTGSIDTARKPVSRDISKIIWQARQRNMGMI